GQTPDPVTGLCEPADNFVQQKAALVLTGIDALTGGGAIDAARELVCAGTSSSVMGLDALDANGDGQLTFDEELDADVLAVARRLVPQSQRQSPGALSGGDRAVLNASLTAFRQQMRDDLALGIANEKPVAAPIASMQGDVCGYLELAAAAR